MFTLMFKTILALFPFIREIVNSSQQGPRDRRTKNPLTPWLVITIVYILASTTSAGTYIIQLLDKERKYTLENTKFSHQIKLSEAVTDENLELKKQIRDLHTELEEAEDDCASTKRRNEELVSESGQLRAELSTLNTQNKVLASEVGRLKSELEAKAATRQPVVVTTPVKQKSESRRTRALLNELTN